MSKEEKENLPESSNPAPTERRRVILLVISVVVILTLGLFLYFSKSENFRLRSEKAATEEQLETAYVRLDSMSQELVLKIEEVKSLGQNVEELDSIKTQLEEEKSALRKAKNIQIRDLRDRVEGYSQLLKQKDIEIAQLRAVNEQLLSENTDLKTEKQELNQSISSLNQEREKLAQKVRLASRLQAENIEITGITNRGKEKSGVLRSRQLDKLKIDFNLARNEVAPIGGKDIIIRLVDQNDQVLFDVATGSGTFMIDGKEEFYTAKKEILFDNTGQALSFMYDKGSEYAPGRYDVEIYADNYVIGREAFVVR